jgi:hypothetical protein
VVEKIYQCPKCGKFNTDNWPVNVLGEVKEGGCQMCWEHECDDAWWDAVCAFEEVMEAAK